MRRHAPILTALAFAAALPAAAQSPPAATQTPPAAAPEPPLQGSLGPPVYEGRCAPPQLFRMTMRNISPGLAAADRAAQPRDLWRQGDRFLRSEESPDPVRGQTTVIIIAEPDIWAYDQVSRTGRHSVDPGPELVVRAPVLPPAPDLPAPFRTLEFGCEAAFVAAYAPQPQRLAPWGATGAALHTVTMGDHTLAFLMDARRPIPLMVSYLRRGQPVLVLRYDEYRHGLPDRPQLFQVPRNIKITETGAEPPPRPLGPPASD